MAWEDGCDSVGAGAQTRDLVLAILVCDGVLPAGGAAKPVGAALSEDLWTAVRVRSAQGARKSGKATKRLSSATVCGMSFILSLSLLNYSFIKNWSIGVLE